MSTPLGRKSGLCVLHHPQELCSCARRPVDHAYPSLFKWSFRSVSRLPPTNPRSRRCMTNIHWSWMGQELSPINCRYAIWGVVFHRLRLAALFILSDVFQYHILGRLLEHDILGNAPTDGTQFGRESTFEIEITNVDFIHATIGALSPNLQHVPLSSFASTFPPPQIPPLPLAYPTS